MVYFIADIENNKVKIGFSERPYRRLATLKREHGENLQLLKSVEGGYGLERKLHAKYKDYNVGGEWFMLNKVAELGLSHDHGLQIRKIGEAEFYINSNGYFYLLHLQNVISQERLGRGLSAMSISAYQSQKGFKEFLDSMKEAGLKPYDSKYFVHPYIAYEMIRTFTLHIKIDLYKHLLNR